MCAWLLVGLGGSVRGAANCSSRRCEIALETFFTYFTRVGQVLASAEILFKKHFFFFFSFDCLCKCASVAAVNHHTSINAAFFR